MKNLPKINPAKAVKASLPYVLAGLLCTKLGEAYRLTTGGDVLDKLLAAFTKLGLVFQDPLPSFHPFDLLVGVVAAVLLRLVVWSKIKNAKKYRHGEEYGTARWGNEKDIAPFINSDFSQNILLTDTERLTLGKIADPEKRNVNLNVLVIGGSGSGKTRYHIKPNLLQMNASYVCSDPKGTVVEEIGRALVQQGHYKLKILNTIDFSCSMHYNPFHYGNPLMPIEKSLIDRCISLVYRDYLKNPRPENMPILGDLYQCLREQHNSRADDLATAMEIYVTGSLSYLNHRTNVDLNNRMVCYNISKLGQGLKKLVMSNVQKHIWQRTAVNRYAGITTRIFLDEFHLLLKEPQTAAYTAEIYKRFRKWNGIPTSLTQNVKDLLDSSEIENILENSDFVLMLNQGASDRNILAQRLGISPQELSHVTNSSEGEGLLFFGDKIIPFEDKFPRDTQLYRVMTTKPSDLAA